MENTINLLNYYLELDGKDLQDLHPIDYENLSNLIDLSILLKEKFNKNGVQI
jgi:hypothetical protein